MLTTIPRYHVQLVRESSQPYKPQPISQSADGAKAFRPFFSGLDREQFGIITLDAKNCPIGWSLVSVGTLNLSLVHPRETFKPAILANAARILICHNHPSGDTTPSSDDRTVTTRLVQAGEILGIQILDHIILGDETDEYYSFADSGLLFA